MSAEQKQLIEFAIQDLISAIVAHEGKSPEEAMDEVYHSKFFTKLIDSESGLYRESGEYLYNCMKSGTLTVAS